MPGEKIKHIHHDAKKLQERGAVQAIDLSRLLGKLNDARQAIPPVPLFYRNLQQCLNVALNGGPGTTQPLPTCCNQQWRRARTPWTGRCLLAKKPDLVIETDAVGGHPARRSGQGALVPDREASNA